MREFRHLHRDQGGFSLVELMVVVMLLGVIGAAISQTVVTTMRHQREGVSHITTLNNAKTAFERISQEVRAANPLERTDRYELKVTSAYDGVVRTQTYCIDDAADGTWELTVFTLSGPADTTTCGTATAKRPVLRGLVRDTAYDPFVYLDEEDDPIPFDGAGRVTATEVRAVRFDLRMTVPANGWVIPMESTVSIRNIDRSR